MTGTAAQCWCSIMRALEPATASSQRQLQGIIPPVALQVQGAQHPATPLQRRGDGVVPVDQLQEPPRLFSRRSVPRPAPVANRLDGLVQAGQGTLERRQRASCRATIISPGSDN
jgi:hypothetical protein